MILSHFYLKLDNQSLTLFFLQVIIFVKTCHACQLLNMTLNRLGYQSVALHSMKPQRERSSALSQFRSQQVNLLMCYFIMFI